MAGPAGTTLSSASGTLFTLQPGDTGYETLSTSAPLKAGVGYWLYIPDGSQATLATSTSPPVVVQLPPAQWIMIGNPGTTTATVSGADMVLTYDPVRGYNQSTQLQPGQGALAISYRGGQATVGDSNSPP